MQDTEWPTTGHPWEAHPGDAQAWPHWHQRSSAGTPPFPVQPGLRPGVQPEVMALTQVWAAPIWRSLCIPPSGTSRGGGFSLQL